MLSNELEKLNDKINNTICNDEKVGSYVLGKIVAIADFYYVVKIGNTVCTIYSKLQDDMFISKDIVEKQLKVNI